MIRLWIEKISIIQTEWIKSDMKIFPKLFLASSMSFLVVIGLMLFVIQWRFEQDLTRYINNIENNQLEVFASELEEYYAEVQTWDFL